MYSRMSRPAVADFRSRTLSLLQDQDGSESPRQYFSSRRHNNNIHRVGGRNTPGIREPSGRVKTYRVEMRLRASGWTTSTKTWVGTFDAREKAMRAYDAALHYTGKSPHYFTYPKGFFDDRLSPGLEGAPQSNMFVCFIKSMAKKYAMDTRKLLRNPRSQATTSTTCSRSSGGGGGGGSSSSSRSRDDRRDEAAAAAFMRLETSTSPQKTFTTRSSQATGVLLSSCAADSELVRNESQLGVELAEEVDFATSSTWQLGPSLLDPEAADFNARILQTIVADDHHHETMKFDMSFSTDEYDIDTDGLTLDDHYDHHLQCRIDNEPDWFNCFSSPPPGR
ncbi:unnamed protein product [Sphagnum troendelagicum]|uniref:AP2/ERF domain-containing protein n=1 Tax=Sphagnum troendelagicum TaxID=128251 RepID=A0ABP0UAT4_9BRYO